MKTMRMLMITILLLVLSVNAVAADSSDKYEMIELGTLGGFASNVADINEAGQIVGQSNSVSGYNHAFLWDNGVMIDLGTLSDSYRYSLAVAINQRGQIIGNNATFKPTSGRRAFVWEKGLMIDLGTLGGSESIAFAINDGGQIVGSSRYANGENHGFLWEYFREME